MATASQVVLKALLTHIDEFWTRHRKDLVKLEVDPRLPDLRITRIYAGPDNPTEPCAHVTLG